MNGWAMDLNEELEKSGLRDKYDLYVEANDLNEKNRHVQFYIDYLNGETKEPYTWAMDYGLKMPIFTKEKYDEASKYYDIDSEITTPPKRGEMLDILKELGYADDINKKRIAKINTFRKTSYSLDVR